jgi:hypothetical protein
VAQQADREELSATVDATGAAVRHLTATTFRGWAALALHQPPLELHVVPAIGGRLMGIALGGAQLCFINPALAGRTPGEDDDPAAWRALCGEWGFPLWGGGKTWVAPETDWPDGAPHRDLDSGPYTVLARWCDDESMGVELESGVCRQSRLQIRRRIELLAGRSAWTVTHTLTNRGPVARRCGIWDVLMLRRPALVRARLPAMRTDWRGGVHLVFTRAPVADLFDAGVVSSADGDVLLRCDEAMEYKVAIDSDCGEIGARLRDSQASPAPDVEVEYVRTSPIEAGASYAHGHPLEVFNAPVLPYFEIETHSAVESLPAGGAMTYPVREEVRVTSARASR